MCRVCSRLAEDQLLTLQPDVDTPFRDAADVVKRLLPYHIYQHPFEDLAPLLHPSKKGKMKATEEDLLREEIAGTRNALPFIVIFASRKFRAQETKFALQCRKRRDALENRFRRARVSSGKVRTGPIHLFGFFAE